MQADQLSADEIFAEALRRPEGSERVKYLDEVLGHDAAARERMERLLRAHADAHSFFLEAPAADPMAGVEHLAEVPGTVIGPYKLLEQIGEGGFGVVFLAEQERPVRRRVALKIIKPGMDTRQVIARFEAERQALAMMDHPNIAKVFDAGTTGDPLPSSIQHPASSIQHTGRPYFVMELVQGVPITEYCDQCNLTTRERLELFITVCQAVQHAHQQGIIHRDIKPTNVLVAMQDGQPAPKIIDFGVAKAIDQRLTEHTLTTAFAQMIGSPLYMSPEQAELSPLGVDTRSDIYSLGVLLYELLTGSTPLDKERLHAASYDELRRIIREEEPPKPSARLSQLARPSRPASSPGASPAETAGLYDATTVAERRRTDARHLGQQVRGELDWIVMKCLEKDRNLRYETPNSLARDIERYLHDEPVQACPPSAGYRLKKFARRNKTLLATGGAIGSALVVGLGLSAWMYFRATTESVRAQAVSNLLNEMLGSASQVGGVETDYTVRQLMIYDDIRIAYFLADTHKDDEAAEFVRKAALKAKRLEDPSGLANSLYYVALMQLRLKDVASYRANCKTLFDVPVGDLGDLGRSRPIWASCLGPQALEDLNLLVARAEDYFANASPDFHHFALAVLGAALYRAGQYERAADELRRSIDVYVSDSPKPFYDMSNYQRLFLAMCKWQLGEKEGARRLLAELQTAVDKELQSTSIVWNRRATLEVLRDEAEALIGQKEKRRGRGERNP